MKVVEHKEDLTTPEPTPKKWKQSKIRRMRKKLSQSQNQKTKAKAKAKPEKMKGKEDKITKPIVKRRVIQKSAPIDEPPVKNRDGPTKPATQYAYIGYG